MSDQRKSLCQECHRVTTFRAWRPGVYGRWLAPVCVFHGGFDPDAPDDER
jgi:hypothetical protein